MDEVLTHVRLKSPERIGWLLSSLSGVNFEKGKRLLAEAPDDVRTLAEAHARKLVKDMIASGSPALAEFYNDHPYNDTE
jgi:hypothetical protein